MIAFLLLITLIEKKVFRITVDAKLSNFDNICNTSMKSFCYTKENINCSCYTEKAHCYEKGISDQMYETLCLK